MDRLVEEKRRMYEEARAAEEEVMAQRWVMPLGAFNALICMDQTSRRLSMVANVLMRLASWPAGLAFEGQMTVENIHQLAGSITTIKTSNACA